jgi:hypothetical protein
VRPAIERFARKLVKRELERPMRKIVHELTVSGIANNLTAGQLRHLPER